MELVVALVGMMVGMIDGDEVDGKDDDSYRVGGDGGGDGNDGACTNVINGDDGGNGSTAGNSESSDDDIMGAGM